MSFLSFFKEVKKVDKLIINKGWSVYKKKISDVRYLSNTHRILVNKFEKSKHFDDKKFLCNTAGLKQEHLTREKFFITELNHAHNVIQNSIAYSNNIENSSLTKEDVRVTDVQSILDKHWDDTMTTAEMLENFEILSYYAQNNNEYINDSKYQKILESLANRLPDFSYSDLHYLMKSLILWNNNSDNENYTTFWKQIDQECLKRLKTWSVDEILSMNDLFYGAKLQRFSEFTWHSLRRIGRKPKYMSPSNLVQFAFFMKVCRYLRIPVYNIEYYLEQYKDKLTIEELGVIAMAFRKYNASIKSADFLSHFIQELEKNIDTVSEVTLTSILKIINVRFQPSNFDQIDQLIKAFESRISKFSIPVLVNMLFWLNDARLRKDDYVFKILDRCEKEVETITLKGFEKIFQTLFTLNYDPKTISFYDVSIKEILRPERVDEIERMKKLFIKINSLLIQQNIYSEEALKRVMSPELVQNFATYETLNPEYLMLHYCIEIEHPEYAGPRLNEDFVNYLLKRYGVLSNYSKYKNLKPLQKFNILTEIESICQQICGSESATFIDNLLPHLATTDIIVCYDPETNQYVSPIESLTEIPKGTVKYAPKDGKEWYAIIVVPILLFTKDTHEPTGPLVLRLRQTERIGYKPKLISLHKWKELNDETEKQNYIRNLLSR